MAENKITGGMAQKSYCDKNGYPHFAPSSGRCYRCNQQIYGDDVQQISVDRAGKTHVTECPLCCWSFCD